MSGRLGEATQHFIKALETVGSCGLMSQQADPNTGLALGTYPQAFSHVGLINVALTLHQELRQTHTGRSADTRPRVTGTT